MPFAINWGRDDRPRGHPHGPPALDVECMDLVPAVRSIEQQLTIPAVVPTLHVGLHRAATSMVTNLRQLAMLAKLPASAAIAFDHEKQVMTGGPVRDLRPWHGVGAPPPVPATASLDERRQAAHGTGQDFVIEFDIRSLSLQWASAYDARFLEGLLAWCRQLIISSWTNVESFSAALWRDAVNTCPGLLDYFVNPPGARTDRQHAVKIGVDVLSSHGYDASGALGTILHDEEVFKFDGLTNITKSHKTAFGNNAANLLGGRLHVLEAMRHVLVHNAGVVGGGFLKDRARAPAGVFEPPLMALDRGDHVPVNSQMATEFIRLAVDVCLGLLGVADSAIKARCAAAPP